MPLKSHGHVTDLRASGNSATCDPVNRFVELGVLACPVQGMQSWADSFSLERLTGLKALEGGWRKPLPFLVSAVCSININ